VRGESGTGKELIARALHRASPRADRPMLAVNCAAIPSELVDSQLFGHKAGSFTGADRDHVGYFQQADLGTLFLDEIGELGLQAQSKLLRVLEGHSFLAVGGTHEIKVDARVVAATNRDLLAQVREKMLGYSWPGNVRQLRNVMDSAVVLAAGDQIQPGDLGLRDAGTAEATSLKIEDWERKLIIEALKRTGDNIPESARLLGIGRATLYRKIEEFAIQRRE
jgi:DNA-binding NtrC family response regulator